MTLHTYTPQPMALPIMNFLHPTVSRRPPAHPDTMGENNTPTALKGCGVKRGKTVIAPDRSVVSVTSWCEAKLLTENCIAGNRLVNSVTG